LKVCQLDFSLVTFGSAKPLLHSNFVILVRKLVNKLFMGQQVAQLRDRHHGGDDYDDDDDDDDVEKGSR
jgi:hypothetical protein